jgi:hypothetical protein
MPHPTTSACQNARLPFGLTVALLAMAAIVSTGVSASAQSSEVAPEIVARMAKEKEARRACKVDICTAFAKPDAGAPIACDVTKTWTQQEITEKIVGGSYSAVSYVFSGDGTTQIQVGTGSSALFQLSGTESIVDQLAVGSRQFTLGSGLTGATLSDDSFASNQQSLLTTNLGTSATFVSPTAQLTIASGVAAVSSG